MSTTESSAKSFAPSATQLLMPSFVVQHGKGQEAIDFYVSLFNAKVVMRFDWEDKSKGVMYAQFALEQPDKEWVSCFGLTEGDDKSRGGDAVSMSNWPTISLYLYHPDPDAICKAVKEQGCQVVYEPETKFFGRYEFAFKDHYGVVWTITKVVQPPSTS